MQTLLELAGIFLSSFVIGFSGAMMPGPLLAVTITQSTRRGMSAGPLIVLGHMILEAVLVAGIAFGLAGFLTNNLVIGIIAMLGGGVMCWMGQDMTRSARTISIGGTDGDHSGMHPVIAGIVVSLSNPYWTIWWATIGITYVIISLEFGIPGLLVFFVGHILSDLVWYTLVSFSIAKGRKIISGRIYRAVIAICGIALILFGIWFLWTGYVKLLK